MSNELDGKEVSIDETLSNIIKKYNREFVKALTTQSEIEQAELLPPFKNIITDRSEKCAKGLGVIAYLVNTDKYNSYNVTIRK